MDEQEILKELKLIEFKFGGTIVRCNDMQRLKDIMIDDVTLLINQIEKDKLKQ